MSKHKIKKDKDIKSYALTYFDLRPWKPIILLLISLKLIQRNNSQLHPKYFTYVKQIDQLYEHRHNKYPGKARNFNNLTED